MGFAIKIFAIHKLKYMISIKQSQWLREFEINLLLFLLYLEV